MVNGTGIYPVLSCGTMGWDRHKDTYIHVVNGTDWDMSFHTVYWDEMDIRMHNNTCGEWDYVIGWTLEYTPLHYKASGPYYREQLDVAQGLHNSSCLLLWVIVHALTLYPWVISCLIPYCLRYIGTCP